MKKLLSIILTILMVVTMIPFTPVAFAADDYAVVDTEAGTVTIDGTLGGKTTATEDDVNALVEKLKGYVDSGITTIIVTGSEPALHNFYDIDTPAVSAALYYLADNNYDSPYCGTIDLILPDVTEIVDDEFNNTFALNSITLPKVTKLGDLAFYACCFIQTIAFGSVVTDVEEGGGVMFAVVGQEVGGCDLILNCGQMNSSYIPDLDTNTWKFRYENEFKSITLTHTGGEATCIAKAVCETCGEEYGEFDANKHTLVQKDAKAPTCTEIGWDAYESCTECDYTTYEVLLADPDAHNFEDGKCECGYVCTHETYSEGVCVDCGEVIYTYDEATDTYTVYTFAALKAALTAGGNIILGADIIRENTKDITAVPENITAVLDLNGKTITSAPAVPGVNYEIICVNGNLTIKDSDTNGTITANSVISCIYVEGGNLTIEAGNFICDPDLSFAVDVYSGNAVINGGTFTNFNVFDEGKAVINGGEFQNYISTSGSLIINGGTFYGEEYTFGTFGGNWVFDIYGGEFHEDPSEYVANGYEAVANENGTWTVVCAHTDKLVQVDAKAPTCTEIGWEAYEYCTACDYTTYEEIPVSTHVDANCDYKCDYNCGYVYETPDFSDAKVLSTDADGYLYIDGQKIDVYLNYFDEERQLIPSGKYKLEGDIETINCTPGIKSQENVIINLDGYKWTFEGLEHLLLEGELSIYDLSEKETGKLVASSSWGVVSIQDKGAVFNLYSGTLESINTYALRCTSGTVNLYGGKIKGSKYAISYMSSNTKGLNIDDTVIESGDDYADIFISLGVNDIAGAVDVTDYKGDSLTASVSLYDTVGKITVFKGIKNAQDAEKYQITDVVCDDYYDLFWEKTEYDEATGEKSIYIVNKSFIQQPTVDNNYTVDFNYPATFQWYEVEEKNLGTYIVEEFSPLFSYDFKADDILVISTDSEFRHVVIETGIIDTDYEYIDLDEYEKTATITFDADTTVDLFVAIVNADNPVEVNFTVFKATKLDGETEKTLQNAECGKSYCCKATVGEKVYVSDSVDVGHSIVYVDAQAPTCTEIGWEAYEYCTACDYTTYTEKEAFNHKDTLVQVEAKAPTCTEIGWDAYEYCTACTYTTYVEKEALKHSFTKYEVTEEAKCGVEGKEVAYCDNGCGATDEKAIEALTHKDADGDYKCDNGCGHEFEKPAPEEPTPDTPDEPTDDACDHLCHKTGILGFFWKIVKFFSKLFKLNPVCECGVAHY